MPGKLAEQVQRIASLLGELRSTPGVPGERLEPIQRAMGELRHDLLIRADKAQMYMDVAEVMIVAVEADQRVSMINRKGCEVLECNETGIVGANWFDAFVPTRLREARRAKFLEAMASGILEPYFEGAVLTRAGRERIIFWHQALVGGEDGRPSGTLGSGQDITQRRITEAQRDLLTYAMEQAGEAIIITDAHGVIQYVNQAFEPITGYTREEAIGQNPRILKSGKQDQPFYERLWKTLLSKHIWHGRLINRRKDGSLYEVESTISPILGPQGDDMGHIVNFVEVQRDVSQQVDMESRLRQAAKLEAIGRLAGGVAHDFNNQLTVIKGYCELLLQEQAADSPAREAIEEIRRAAERSATMTSQLLAFSRKQVLYPQVVNLNEVLMEMSKTLGRLIGERIRLAVRCGAELGDVEVDPGQLQQAIMNLVINARDAMPAGGSLTIETAAVTLDEHHVALDRDVPPGQYVMLAISDTGTGMTPEVRRRVFEPFFTTKDVGKGTGLGLAMVHGFVRQSGGRIAVYSEPGRGTTFRIYLPLLPASTERMVQEVETEPFVRGPETILVVEDEPSVRGLVVRLLRERGWNVLEAGSPHEALAMVGKRDGPIDLLISDVVMPGMEGPELGRRLTRLRPGIRILYITGYAEHAVAEHGLAGGHTDILTKPFSASALSRKIRELLYERQTAGK